MVASPTIPSSLFAITQSYLVENAGLVQSRSMLLASDYSAALRFRQAIRRE